MAARGIGPRFAPAVLIAGATFVAAACSSDDSGSGGGGICASDGNCPNRAPPSPSSVSRCQDALGDAKCGSLFRAYFDCAIQQEKCNAEGVTDDPATRAAITANCADSITAYRACGGTISTETTCGLTGLPCCTDGSPPCASTGCCDPGTNKCRGQGEACTAASSVCSANQCSACGAPGRPCCQVYGTTQPNPCPSGGCCDYSAGQLGGSCIPEGGQCDAPGPNTTETVCHSGSCMTCGSELGTCCAGNTCKVAGNVCSGTTCVP